MKIAITGHNHGIGLSLSKIYQSNGHDVLGFSRSNHYDISDPISRKQIIKESQDCNIFFNNAHDWDGGHDFSEVELLSELWTSWRGQHKTIVNISSSTTTRWEQGNNCSLTYRSAKLALEKTCELLWNTESWPLVTVVAPCLTATRRTSFKADANKADPDEVAQLVYHALNQTSFRVQILKLAVLPVDSNETR